MIFSISLFSGLIIEPDQIRAGIRDARATAVAMGLIIVLSPLLRIERGRRESAIFMGAQKTLPLMDSYLRIGEAAPEPA